VGEAGGEGNGWRARLLREGLAEEEAGCGQGQGGAGQAGAAAGGCAGLRVLIPSEAVLPDCGTLSTGRPGGGSPM
jgi:hypothetical protein